MKLLQISLTNMEISWRILVRLFRYVLRTFPCQPCRLGSISLHKHLELSTKVTEGTQINHGVRCY